MRHIGNLFSIPFFRDHNSDLIEPSKRLFELTKDFLNYTERAKLNTTLKSYGPGKTKTSVDLEQFEEGAILKKYFETSVYNFLKDLQYNADSKEINVCNMWINIMSRGSSQSYHVHYGYTFSGVYYVECIEPNDFINFHRPQALYMATISNPIEYNLMNSEYWSLPVLPGNIVIFPSYVEHGVDEISVDQTRKSIAFDVIVHNE